MIATTSQTDPQLRTLIDDLFDQQQRLQTPVALFAEKIRGDHAMESHFRNLIPLSKPAAHEQYAFEVALDRCTGCKACVSACHSLNGLDAHESWRDVGVLYGGNEDPAWQQTLTSACHHCGSPSCLEGCPVGAYEKDKVTGIVRHLDDQCIGCSYCILKCPYDVPKYSAKRGIVRKCDMCQQRLAVGEAPACVQACPTEAIRIIKVDRVEKFDLGHRGLDFIPGAPGPEITNPMTRYTGRSVPLSARPINQATLRKEDAHVPLVLMLTLTQAGAGLVCASAFQAPYLWHGIAIYLLGMIASVFHLGRPLGAWRFFIGLKTSWLSREILAFSLLTPLILLQGLLPWVPHTLSSALQPFGNVAVVFFSAVAVFTSVMIYVDTKRAFWRMPHTGLKFFGTFLLFFSLAWIPSWTVAIAMIKLATEAIFLIRSHQLTEQSTDRFTARVQWQLMRGIVVARFSLLSFAAVAVWFSPMLFILSALIAELFERLLFFQSVFAPRMTSQHHRS